MSNFTEPLVFIACLLAGPIVIGRLFPQRTNVTGNHLSGQSGVSSVFWGIPAGMFTAFALLLIINPPTVYQSQQKLIQSTILLFAILSALSAPLLIWGAHLWSWDAEGLEFRSLFKRRKVAWSEITQVTPAREGGFSVSTAQGVAFRTSRHVAGNQIIIAALHHYRQSVFTRSE